MSRCCRTARPASSRCRERFDHLESLHAGTLRGVAGVGPVWEGRAGDEVERNYSAPAEPELVQQLARRRLVITGVGD